MPEEQGIAALTLQEKSIVDVQIGGFLKSVNRSKGSPHLPQPKNARKTAAGHPRTNIRVVRKLGWHFAKGGKPGAKEERPWDEDFEPAALWSRGWWQKAGTKAHIAYNRKGNERCSRGGWNEQRARAVKYTCTHTRAKTRAGASVCEKARGVESRETERKGERERER